MKKIVLTIVIIFIIVATGYAYWNASLLRTYLFHADTTDDLKEIIKTIIDEVDVIKKEIEYYDLDDLESRISDLEYEVLGY